MSEESRVSPILDDQPTAKDALDFAPYRDTLVGILRDPATNTPLTVGIFGTWGSGKTSLMKMIEASLESESAEDERWIRTLWFDAWKYDREEVLWRALLLQVLNCLETDEISEDDAQKIADWRQRLYEDVEREELGELSFNLGQAGKGVLKLGLGLLPGLQPVKELLTAWESDPSSVLDDLAAAFRRQRIEIHERKIQFLEEFQAGLAGLVHDYVESQGGLLVAFVDDLDRCLPERAIEVLEAIKLFLDVPGCVFILGLDREAIIEAVQTRYKDEVKGEQYLEKIIQLPFLLPPIEPEDMADFVKELAPVLPDERCTEVFALGLTPNPRQVKRTINIFLLLWKLSRERLAEQIKPVRLAKVVVIQHSHPDLYALLRETPRLLRDLEAHFRTEEAQAAQRGLSTDVSELEGEERPERPTTPPLLEPFVARRTLRRLLTLHPQEGPISEDANFVDLTPEELRAYIYLARRAVPELVEEVARPFFKPQTVRVPEGEFLMGSTAEEIAALVKEYREDQIWFERERPQESIYTRAFEIGKYAVTNLEYRAFVQETGHAPPRHWEGGSYPEGLGDHPVVYVSWHDAREYCDWLHEKTGRPYRLPTEVEWEKAARGTDGRRYPWGDEFDKARCNSIESGVGGTTPVGQYSPQGDSPYGAADVAGNVWEWTSSLLKEYPYDPDDGREDPKAGGFRVLRGGAFYSNLRGDVRCAFRYGNFPYDRSTLIGFRVVVSSGSPE